MQSIDAVAGLSPVRGKLRPLGAGSLVILAALTASEPALGPLSPLPDSAVRFAPPAQYQEWWARTESCAGRHSHPVGIAWYVVPDASAFWTPQGRVVGRWSRGSDGARIVIAGGRLGDELVVRHEMLHALLDRGDHPPKAFAEQCHLTWESAGRREPR